MFFTDKSELESLNFSCRDPRFSLAQIEWQGVVLNPRPEDAPIVDLSDQALDRVLAQLFSPLSFIECAELYGACKMHPGLCEALEASNFFPQQNLRWDARTLELFEAILNSPQWFRDWGHSKKLSPGDLWPILSLKDTSAFYSVASELKALSRSDGKRAIDLLVDLLLMNHPVDELMAPPATSWIDHLFAIRYPETLQRDRQTPSAGEKLPRFAQIHQQRLGDQLTHRLSIQYSDAHDLKAKLSRLGEMNF